MKPLATLAAQLDRAKFVDGGLVAWSSSRPQAAAYSAFNTKVFAGEVAPIQAIADVDYCSNGLVAIAGKAGLAFCVGRTTRFVVPGGGGRPVPAVAVAALPNGALVADESCRLVLVSSAPTAGQSHPVAGLIGADGEPSRAVLLRRGFDGSQCIAALEDGTVAIFRFSVAEQVLQFARSLRPPGIRGTLQGMTVAGGNLLWMFAAGQLHCLHVSSATAALRNNDGDALPPAEVEMLPLAFANRAAGGRGGRASPAAPSTTIRVDAADGTNVFLMPNRHTGSVKLAALRANDRGCSTLQLTSVDVAMGAGAGRITVDVCRSAVDVPKAQVLDMQAPGGTDVYRLLIINDEGSRCIECLTQDLRGAAILDRSSDAAATLQQRITWCVPDELPALRAACEQRLNDLLQSLPPATAPESNAALATIAELQSVAFSLFQREVELVQDAISGEDSISVLFNRKLRVAYLLTVTASMLQSIGVFDQLASLPLADLLHSGPTAAAEQSTQFGELFHTTFHLHTQLAGDAVLELTRWSRAQPLVHVLLQQLSLSCGVVTATMPLLGLLQLVLGQVTALPEALALLIGYAAWQAAPDPSLVDAALASWLEAVQLRPSLAHWSRALCSADHPTDGSSVLSVLAGLDTGVSVGAALVGPLVDSLCGANRFEEAYAVLPVAMALDDIPDRLAVKLLFLCYLRGNASLLAQLFRRSANTTWRPVATTVLAHTAVRRMQPEVLEGLVAPNSREEQQLRAALGSIADERAERLRIDAMVMLHHYEEALALCRAFRVKSAGNADAKLTLQLYLQSLVNEAGADRSGSMPGSSLGASSSEQDGGRATSTLPPPSVLNSKVLGMEPRVVAAADAHVPLNTSFGVGTRSTPALSSLAVTVTAARPSSQNISLGSIAAATPRR